MKPNANHPGSPTRLLLADDHAVLRAGLRALLEREEDIVVVGEAESGTEAEEKARVLQPDVVIMDLTMPGGGGVNATRRLRKQLPKTKVLVLTMHEDRSMLDQVLRAGASGYVVKRAVHTELITAIRAVARGDMFLDPSLVKTVVPDIVAASQRLDGDGSGSGEPLTERERDVLRLIALGYTNRRIGEKLFIGVRTVETHRAHVMEKTGARDRAGLVQCALKLGLIDRETSG